MGHLVISRRISERIKIGADIEIMIVDILNGKVDIGVKAPHNILIERMPSHYAEEEQKRHGVSGNVRSRPQET